jgi:hypothetical protein
MGVALSWIGLILCIGLFLAFVEISWQAFIWSFKIVDDHLQERHWRMQADELVKMYSESEEMAA